MRAGADSMSGRFNIRQTSLAIVLAISTATPVAAGEFCRVSNSGVSGPCFPTLSACEFGLEVSGGTCTYRETSSTSPANDPTGMAALGGLLRMIAEDERRNRQDAEARAALAERQRLSAEQARLAQAEATRAEAQTRARDQAALDRLPEFGLTCADLGFKTGSNSYSDCVIELYRRARSK
jgi:hypothetical protein